MENIWGLEGCKRPDGKGGIENCSACCIGLRIEDPKLQKEELEPCINIVNNQCGIYEQRPQSCINFHCGKAQDNVQLHLLNVAQVMDSANPDVVRERQDIILKNQEG